MIITFCGHSDFYKLPEYRFQTMAVLENISKGTSVAFYLGGYGAFDQFAWECAKRYKELHPDTKLFFITPYLSISYQKTHLNGIEKQYDAILYPELEKVPPRYAILHRNKWMVDKADFIIAYVNHKWGGAYQTYHYAKQKGKAIYNLAPKDPDSKE